MALAHEAGIQIVLRDSNTLGGQVLELSGEASDVGAVILVLLRIALHFLCGWVIYQE